MKSTISRVISTRGRDENIVAAVVFPCNEEDVKELFQVKDLENQNEIYFLDSPDDFTISEFNFIVRNAEDNIAKIESYIQATINFLAIRLEKLCEDDFGHKTTGAADEIYLDDVDYFIWHYFMREDYKPTNENVEISSEKDNVLFVFLPIDSERL